MYLECSHGFAVLPAFDDIGSLFFFTFHSALDPLWVHHLPGMGLGALTFALIPFLFYIFLTFLSTEGIQVIA